MSDESSKKKASVKIEVQLDEDIALGEYVNMARIYHNQTEFVMDAIFLPPQSTKARVLSRIILSPAHAKFLHAALSQNIKLYEQKFGAIKTKRPGSEPVLH